MLGLRDLRHLEVAKVRDGCFGKEHWPEEMLTEAAMRFDEATPGEMGVVAVVSPVAVLEAFPAEGAIGGLEAVVEVQTVEVVLGWMKLAEVGVAVEVSRPGLIGDALD